MQTLGTLHFLSLKDKQSVSIQHGRKSQGTNFFFLYKRYVYIQYIVLVFIHIVDIINKFCFLLYF